MPHYFIEFLNKWEESAYFYEFRARKHATSNDPQWNWFKISWIELNCTQRAIIYYLYHASGGDSKRKKINEPKRGTPGSDVLQVLLSRPLEAIVAEVRSNWAIYQMQDEELPKIPPLELKWSLLEKMDNNRDSKSGGESFEGSEVPTLRREEKKYREACKRGGITL